MATKTASTAAAASIDNIQKGFGYLSSITERFPENRKPDLTPATNPSERPAQLVRLWEAICPEWLYLDRNPLLTEVAQRLHLDIEDARALMLEGVELPDGTQTHRYRLYDPTQGAHPNSFFYPLLKNRVLNQRVGQDTQVIAERHRASLDAPLRPDSDSTSADKRTLGESLYADQHSLTVPKSVAEKEALLNWARDLGIASTKNAVRVLRMTPLPSDAYTAAQEQLCRDVIAKLAELVPAEDRKRLLSQATPDDALRAHPGLAKDYTLMQAARAARLWTSAPFDAFVRLPSREKHDIEAGLAARDMSLAEQSPTDRPDRSDLGYIARVAGSHNTSASTPEEALKLLCEQLYSLGMAKALGNGAEFTAFARHYLAKVDLRRHDAVRVLRQLSHSWAVPAVRESFLSRVRAGVIEVPAIHPQYGEVSKSKGMLRREIRGYQRQAELEDRLFEGGSSSGVSDRPKHLGAALNRLHRLTPVESRQLENLSRAHGFDRLALARSCPLFHLRRIIAQSDGKLANAILAETKDLAPQLGLQEDLGLRGSAAALATDGREQVTQATQLLLPVDDMPTNEADREAILAHKGLAARWVQFRRQHLAAGVSDEAIEARWNAYRTACFAQPNELLVLRASLSEDVPKLSAICMRASHQEIARMAQCPAAKLPEYLDAFFGSVTPPPSAAPAPQEPTYEASSQTTLESAADAEFEQ